MRNEVKEKLKSEQLFALLKDKPFWIWDRHEHLLQYLKTQGKCCFNHIIGEPKKRGVLHPLY
jgi:hypothetical protein